ncbi:zinc-ribbon domain-containing protein, partial [Atopobiaceae bacterium HCP3S3_D6]
MYCNNCGARIERDGSSFCPYCGAPLDAAPPDDPSASDAAPAAPTGAADAPGPKPADAPGA